MGFERSLVDELAAAFERRGRALVQVLVGPRQVGKTTAAAQIERRLGWPCVTASADAAIPHPPEWIETQWRLGRMRATAGEGGGPPGVGRSSEQSGRNQGP